MVSFNSVSAINTGSHDMNVSWIVQEHTNINYPPKSISTYLWQRTYINIHSLCKWYWSLHYWSDSIIVWYLVMHWLWRSEFWTTRTIIGKFFLSNWATQLDSAWLSLTQLDSAWLSLTQLDLAGLSLTQLDLESVNIIERMNHSTYTQVYQVFLFEESWIKRQKWYIFQLQFLPRKLANLWLQTTFININIEQQNKNHTCNIFTHFWIQALHWSKSFTWYMFFPKVGWKSSSHGW